MAGVVGSDGKRGAADTGWNAAQPSCGMAAGRRKRTKVGGSTKVIYGGTPGNDVDVELCYKLHIGYKLHI